MSKVLGHYWLHLLSEPLWQPCRFVDIETLVGHYLLAWCKLVNTDHFRQELSIFAMLLSNRSITTINQFDHHFLLRFQRIFPNTASNDADEVAGNFLIASLSKAQYIMPAKINTLDFSLHPGQLNYAYLQFLCDSKKSTKSLFKVWKNVSPLLHVSANEAVRMSLFNDILEWLFLSFNPTKTGTCIWQNILHT